MTIDPTNHGPSNALPPPPRERGHRAVRPRRLTAGALGLVVLVGFAHGCEYRGNQQAQTPQAQPPGPPPQGYPPGAYPPPQPYPPQQYPPPGQPQQPAPTQPAPAPTQTQNTPPAPGQPAPPIVAAIGLPCASDNDFQCAFGRCIQGRCGGCSSASDCKAGAACSQTPFGMTCVYAGQMPTPAPTATTPAPTATTPTPPPVNDAFASARHACLERTNGYRARVGVAPLDLRRHHEPCTDGQAKDDAAANRAHATFGRCGEASQNECPGYPGTPESVVAMCLEQMFAEGPGEPYSAHGHYINMTEKSYKGLACGFFIAPDGKVWLLQNFYR